MGVTMFRKMIESRSHKRTGRKIIGNSRKMLSAVQEMVSTITVLTKNRCCLIELYLIRCKGCVWYDIIK